MPNLELEPISYIKVIRSANNRNLYHLHILVDPGLVIKISGSERDIKRMYEELTYERLY